jgi:hypothetical protein
MKVDFSKKYFNYCPFCLNQLEKYENADIIEIYYRCKKKNCLTYSGSTKFAYGYNEDGDLIYIVIKDYNNNDPFIIKFRKNIFSKEYIEIFTYQNDYMHHLITLNENWNFDIDDPISCARNKINKILSLKEFL